MFSLKKKHSSDVRILGFQEDGNVLKKCQQEPEQSWKFLKIKSLTSDTKLSKTTSIRSLNCGSLREETSHEEDKSRDVIRIVRAPRPCESLVSSMVREERKTIHAFHKKEDVLMELFRLKGGSSERSLMGQGRKGGTRWLNNNTGDQQTFNLNATNQDGKITCTGNPPAKLGLCLELSYTPCEAKKCAEVQTEEEPVQDCCCSPCCCFCTPPRVCGSPCRLQASCCSPSPACRPPICSSAPPPCGPPICSSAPPPCRPPTCSSALPTCRPVACSPAQPPCQPQSILRSPSPPSSRPQLGCLPTLPSSKPQQVAAQKDRPSSSKTKPGAPQSCSTQISPTDEMGEFEVFGMFVGLQLKSMSVEAATKAQKKIQDILLNAKLDEHTMKRRR